jgi:AraC-like DNA-binding protein
MYSLKLTILNSDALPECTARIDRYFEYFTLQLMTEGAIELAYGEEKIALQGRWFWFAKSGPRIRFHPAPGAMFWNHRYVVFQGPLANCWQAEGLLPNRAQPLPDDKDYTEVFDELIYHAHRTAPWGLARTTNLLEQLVLALAEARTQELAGDNWLQTALNWLEITTDFMPDYEQLASDLGMSLSTLRKRFRKSAGKPLHIHVLESRMTRAKTLLGETDIPIKTVAARLGYGDVYYFHHQFQSLVGVTPTAFRNSRQK